MPQIVIAGAPTGCWTNLGDEAILAGMVASLGDAFPGFDIVVVSSSPAGFLDSYGCRAVAYDDVEGLERAIATSDLVLLGGGSIFFDYWGCDPHATLTGRHQGLSLWAGIALLSAAHDRPLMVYGAGVGPLSTPDGRLLAAAVFELAHVTTVRDRAALATLDGLRLDNVAGVATGDPALRVELPDPPLPNAPRPWLGVALRQWDLSVDAPTWPIETAEALDTHLARAGGSAMFIPCHRAVSWPLTDDRAAADAVIEHMQRHDQAHTVSVELPWDERAALFGHCDLVLAMRYHASLFAMASGVPAVAMSYDPKVTGLMADWGVADLSVPLAELTAAALTERLVRATDADEHDRARLAGTADARRANERDTVARARTLVDHLAGQRLGGRAVRELLARLTTDGEERLPVASHLIGRLAEQASQISSRPTATPPSPSSTRGSAPTRSEGPRRVALLTNQLLDRETGSPCVGGAERYALELARLLRDLGLAPTFFQRGGEAWTEGDYFGFPVIALRQGDAYSEFEYGVSETFFERTQDFDHVLYLMPNYASGTMRDDAIVVSHGVWWDHELWDHLSFRTPEWYEHLERVFARARRVVSVDTNSINVVRALFPRAASRLTYIPSWVDAERFHPPTRRDRDIPHLLFPRRADVIRGPQLVAPLLELVPDPCTVTWLGGGNPQMLDNLRALTRRDPRFSLGTASFDEMPERYREADICVIPTVGSEGQSLACLEAMASGCAVVATRVGGLPELIRDGVDGLLCDPTPESLAAAVRRVVRDPELRRRLGAGARATALRHALPVWRAQWADLFVELGWATDPTAATPYDIVCFSVINWDFRWQRPQQMMTHWARRGRRVFFLRITDFLPEQGYPVAVDKLADGVWEVRLALPDGFDLHAARDADRLASLGRRGLEALREQFDVDRAVGVVEHAGWTPLATAARTAFGWPIVYDCMDDWSTFPGFADTPSFLAAEERLVAEADAMVVSGRTIQERWAGRRPDVVLARNAVDFDFYRLASSPEPAADRDAPVAGFIGAIAEWFDLDLMLQVARARPDVTFVFVGGVHRVSVDELDTLPNVQFLGQQDYEAMPGYLRLFDVCLVPFEVSPVTDGMDVVKLYEYLSQGKPVVATPIREIVGYRDLLYLAHSADEFVDQLDRALAEDDPALRTRRIELARQNTWDDRIDQIDALILGHLTPGSDDTTSVDASGVDLRPWKAEAERLRQELAAVHGSRVWRAAGVYWRGLNRAKRLAGRWRAGGPAGSVGSGNSG